MNKFDQHIKSKLSQPHVPPLDAWKNIEKELNEKKKKNRIIPLLYFIGSSAACLVVGVSVFYFNHSDSIQKELINHSDKIVKKEIRKTKINSIQQSNLESEVSSLTSHQLNGLVKNKKIFKSNNIITNQTQDNLMNEISYYSDESSHEISSTQKYDLAFSDKINSNNKSHNSFENKTLTENLKQNDSLKQEKSLEFILQEQKKPKNEITVTSSPILAVSSYVNPMKMLGNKSILSDEFNDLSVKNNTTIAYGAKVSIRLNDRINIRSGISKIDLEQSTNNVNYSGNGVEVLLASSSNQNSNTHNNINYNDNIRIISTNYELNGLTSSLSSNTNSSQLEQKISYLEIPLELEYKLGMFKKINLSGTLGGSYYVVTKNTISLTNTMSRDYKIGTASNLNNSSYSANVGLKLQYLLSEKASIDLEPNYRYMMNTLQNVDHKNPSLVGVNLGFSFKF